jgi:hypothetical protein
MTSLNSINYKPSFYGSASNTGIISQEVGAIGPDYMIGNSSGSVVYNTTDGTVTIPKKTVFRSQPAYDNGTTFSVNYNYTPPEIANKRTDVRDDGKIPIDIWAMLYNNGVIDDEFYL